MPCSGCSGLHGVNPNLKKRQKNYTIRKLKKPGIKNNYEV